MQRQYDLETCLRNAERVRRTQKLSNNSESMLEGLLELAAKAHWIRPFTPAEAVIRNQVEISHSTFLRCRKQLIAKRVIYYQKGLAHKPAEYWFGESILSSENAQNGLGFLKVQNEPLNDSKGSVKVQNEPLSSSKGSPLKVQNEPLNEISANENAPQSQVGQGTQPKGSPNNFKGSKMNLYNKNINNINNNHHVIWVQNEPLKHSKGSLKVQNEPLDLKPLTKVIIQLFKKYFNWAVSRTQAQVIDAKINSFDADAAIEAMNRVRSKSPQEPVSYYCSILDHWRKAGTFDLASIDAVIDQPAQDSIGDTNFTDNLDNPLADRDSPIEAQITNYDIQETPDEIAESYKLLGYYCPQDGTIKTDNFIMVTKDHNTKTYELDGDCRYYLLDKLKQRYYLRHKENPTLLENQILAKLNQQLARIKKWQPKYPIEFDIIREDFLGWKRKQIAKAGDLNV